jgi:hypothetical protein
MAVFGAWIIYVTMRGSLPTYLSLLFGTVTGSASTGASSSASPGASPLGSAIGTAATAAQALSLAPLGTVTDLFGNQDFSGGV